MSRSGNTQWTIFSHVVENQKLLGMVLYNFSKPSHIFIFRAQKFQFQLGRIKQSLPIARFLHVTDDCVTLVPVSCRVARDREPFRVPDFFIHFHGFEDGTEVRFDYVAPGPFHASPGAFAVGFSYKL